jgi:Holliday junction resolvase
MNLHTIVLCSVILLVAPLSGREKSDVIVMKNGDHLTCEIKGLNSGVLYVSLDYILGTSSVQWSKVDHLESSQLFIVKTESGLVYTGALSAAELQGDRPMKIEVIVSPETKVAIDRTQIVKMDQTSEKFWQRFNGDINLGVIYSKANQSTQFSLNSAVQYPRERWSAQVSYSSTLASSTGVNASARNQINYSGQRLLRWNNWFYEGLGIFLQSSEQDINLQTMLGGGVGRYLKNTNNAQISLLGGLGWQNTAYRATTESTGTQSLATAVVAGEMRFFRFNKTSIDLSAVVLPALSQPGRVHFNTDASYYVKLFSNLTWNVSFYGNWDTRPPANFSGSDYGTSSGLGWTFGNK